MTDSPHTQTYYDGPGTFSAMSLVDLPGRYHAYPMARRSGPAREDCLCTVSQAWLTRQVQLEPGGPPAVAYAVYWVPAQTTRIAVASRVLGGITEPLAIGQPSTAAPRVLGEPDAQTIADYEARTWPLGTRVETRAQRVTDTGERVRIAIATDVLFAFDRATLTPAARAELRRVADKVGPEASGTVRIVGHTDDVGSDAYNLGLSRRRAAAVETALRRLLAGRGLDFTAEGRGEAEPAVQGTSAQARRRNRRVEVGFERDPRPARQPAPATTTTATTAAPTTAASAAGAGATTTTVPPGGSALGTAEGEGWFEGVTLDVLEARRAGPGAVAVSVRLRNEGSQTPRLDLQGQIDPTPTLDFQDVLTYWAGEFFWLVARDQARTTYFVLTDTGRACVCSLVPYANATDQLRPGSEVRLFAVLAAPPAGTRGIDLTVAGFPEVRGVPLTG